MQTSPEIIKASRVKGTFGLVISLAFTVGGFFMVTDVTPSANPLAGWLVLLFFGLCTIVLGWTQIRPQILFLESDGFTVKGGFVSKPKKVLWSDIDHFFVFRLPRGGSMVGYNYKAGRKPKSRLGEISSAMGADAGLPKGWPMSAEKLTEKMNQFRLEHSEI